jgi:hypothetical protein
MQAQAPEFPGYAGKFRCFWREEFETVCFDLFILEKALAQRLFKSFLARNNPVHAYGT